MIRLSVSDLESYRYWCEKEDATLADLVAQLTKKEPPTPQMQAGAAFAKLMEHAPVGMFDVETVDGWTFVFDLDDAIALPPVRELKAEVVYDTPSGPVMLVGKVDGIDGKIHDQKLTENFDPERYLDSLQWRAYVDMFKAREFVYDVFRAKYDRGPGHKIEVDGEEKYIKGEPTGKVTILEYHPVSFFSYPDVHADVQKAVSELARVVVDYNIPK